MAPTRIKRKLVSAPALADQPPTKIQRTAITRPTRSIVEARGKRNSRQTACKTVSTRSVTARSTRSTEQTRGKRNSRQTACKTISTRSITARPTRSTVKARGKRNSRQTACKTISTRSVTARQTRSAVLARSRTNSGLVAYQTVSRRSVTKSKRTYTRKISKGITQTKQRKSANGAKKQMKEKSRTYTRKVSKRVTQTRGKRSANVANTQVKGKSRMMVFTRQSSIERHGKLKEKNQTHLKLVKERLMESVKKGDVSAVSKLLSSVEKPDASLKNLYDKALLVASQQGHKHIVQLLVSKGASINRKHAESGTPLMAAVENRFLGIVKFLLAEGANVNLRHTRTGDTALLLAIENASSVEMVRHLLRSGASVNAKNKKGRTPALVCIEKYDFDTLRVLFDHRAKLDIPDNHGNTALTVAAQHHVQELVLLLAEKKCRFLSKPLWIAVEQNSIEMTRLLLDCDFINVNAHNFDHYDMTILNAALLRGFIHGLWDPRDMINPAIVELLVKKGANVNEESDGHLPLALSVDSCRINVVKLLLEAGADVDAKAGFSRRTPLMCAAQHGYIDILELLLSRGANVNAAGSFGHTALTCALAEGNMDCAKILLQKGATIASHDALESVINNQYESLKLVLENIDIDASEIKQNVLFTAVQGFSFKIVELLLDYGMYVNATQFSGETIIMEANMPEMVELLLKRGADVCQCGHGNVTPLIHFCSDAKANCSDETVRDIVDILIKNGAEVNAADSKGFTALIKATFSGRDSAIQLLLNAGADVNKVNEEGQTALMTASQRGNIAIMKMLIDHGAEVNSQTSKDGITALMFASMNECIDAVHLLLDKHANVHLEDSRGNTALLVSTEVSVVNRLAAHGADLNHRNSKGRSSLMLAAASRNVPLVKTLIELGADVCALNTVNGENETALSIVMEQVKLSSVDYDCISALLNAGAAKVCSFHCDVTLCRMIIADRRKEVQMCVTKGAAPSLVCIKCLRDYHCLSARVCAQIEESHSALSPLSVALLCGNIDIASYLSANWFLTKDDISPGEDSKQGNIEYLLNLMGREKSIDFLVRFREQPSSLMKLSFVASSDVMGPASGREERVHHSGLPPMLQEQLLFKKELVELEESSSNPFGYYFIIADLVPSSEYDSESDFGSLDELSSFDSEF